MVETKKYKCHQCNAIIILYMQMQQHYTTETKKEKEKEKQRKLPGSALYASKVKSWLVLIQLYCTHTDQSTARLSGSLSHIFRLAPSFVLINCLVAYSLIITKSMTTTRFIFLFQTRRILIQT